MNKRQRKQIVKALLVELSKHGIVTAACKRSGLSAAQFYRWCKEDPEFQAQVDEARMLGTQESNDLARSRLLQKIDQGEGWAIRYHLSRRDPEYKLPPEPRFGLEAGKEALVASAHQVLASALANGDLKAAQFILGRLDQSMMRPKDNLLLEELKQKENVAEELRRNADMLDKLLGLNRNQPTGPEADAS